MFSFQKLKNTVKKLLGISVPDTLKVTIPPGPKLNLGCGSDYRSEWDNWDIILSTKAEAHLDFSRDRFPAVDNYYGEIYSNGVAEQILHNEGILNFFNESHRVLKPGGVFTVITPNANYSIAFRDPHTCKHFTPETFRYFCRGMKSYERYGKLYGYKPWSNFTHSTDARGIMTIILVK